ncbi:MAG: SUF system NifU family Fe-S cluster assembly protein [Bacilli bacterium]|nr:SUF system NifU family Fe-S cluster assembly protein [Bacilli bacterium]
MDVETKREILFDNYTNPYNKVDNEIDGYLKVNSNNESCIDNINIYMKIEDRIIKDIKFSGEACAISTASTSIMIKNMIGMNVEDAIKYVKNFMNMINEEPYNDTNFEEALVFDETYKQASRKTCATLPYRGIIKLLEENK